jgi:uncharacterized integral membrane protein
MSARYKSNFPIIIMILTLVLFGVFIIFMILNPRVPKEKPNNQSGLPTGNYNAVQNK